jgi:hypothetical protein
MFDLDAALKPYIEKSVHRDELSPDVLSKMSFVYPYSKEEYVMSRLLSEGVLPFADYEAIKKEYVAKSQNIALFEMAPRAFGEKWGQGHLQSIVPELLAPNKAIDPNYDGDYDLYYQGVRIEVKASRATDQDRTENNPVAKALPYGTGKRFAMNFQQIKCSHCDVFVWIAVWRDRITYWVIKSTDVLNDSHYQPKAASRQPGRRPILGDGKEHRAIRRVRGDAVESSRKDHRMLLRGSQKAPDAERRPRKTRGLMG